MTRDDLAGVLGKSRWTIRSWELGRRHPRIQDLGKIADALATTVASLLGEVE